MQKRLPIFIVIFFSVITYSCFSQARVDSAVNKKVKDSSARKAIKEINPRTATIRSAIIPGWGQIYNKKYWKLPLVYGALGTTAAVYFYNVKTYNQLRLAYQYITDTFPANNNLIDPRFSNLSAGAIRSYRNSFRQNVDYSALFFILFWGLNVVDATVDAHLKAFNVSDDLSLEIKPGYSPTANTNGISLVLNIGKRYTTK